MMFADMDSTVTLALIAAMQVVCLAVVGLLATIVKEYFDRQRAIQAAAKTDEAAAKATAAVIKKTDEQTTALNQRNDKQDAKLTIIKEQTNGLTAALVQSTGQVRYDAGEKAGGEAGFIAGVKSETDKRE